MSEGDTAANGSQQSAAGAGAASGSNAGAQGTKANAGQQNAGDQSKQNGQGANTNADPFAGLKAPEGFDAAALPKLIEVAKGYGLNAENAQKLLNDTHAAQVKAKADMDAAMAKQKAEWHEAIKADKEYGGDKFEASLQRAQKVVGEIDTKIAPGIKQILDSTGYGDHPAVVRLFNYLGQINREDTFAAGGSSAAEAPQTLAQMLYPKPQP